MRKRYLRVQAQLFDQSRSIIERLILRKVRKMRALKAGLTGAAYAMAVGSIFDKEPSVGRGGGGSIAEAF